MYMCTRARIVVTDTNNNTRVLVLRDFFLLTNFGVRHYYERLVVDFLRFSSVLHFKVYVTFFHAYTQSSG